MIKNIVFKTIGDCNLNCSYCLYMNDLEHKWKTKFKSKDLTQFFSKVSDYNKDFTITWHGGEPLLMGMDFFKAAVSEAKKHHVNLTNTIQTNGLLINQSWCDFFKENNFNVGISLDGGEDLHNKFRPKNVPDGKSSYQSTIDAIKLLQKNQIPHGTLTVVNAEESGNKVFEHLLSLGVKDMDFLLPIKPNEIPPLELNNYINYLIDVFNAWFELDDPSVSIRYFKGIINSLMGGNGTVCTMRNQCSSHITVEPNGDIGMCDVMRLVNSNYYETELNILSNTFFEIEDTINQKIIDNENNILPDTCTACSYREVCRGGCPSARFDGIGSLNRTSSYCKLYKKVINHVYKTVLSTEELSNEQKTEATL